jgi:hypothetical protein
VQTLPVILVVGFLVEVAVVVPKATLPPALCLRGLGKPGKIILALTITITTTTTDNTETMCLWEQNLTFLPASHLLGHRSVKNAAGRKGVARSMGSTTSDTSSSGMFMNA